MNAILKYWLYLVLVIFRDGEQEMKMEARADTHAHYPCLFLGTFQVREFICSGGIIRYFFGPSSAGVSSVSGFLPFPLIMNPTAASIPSTTAAMTAPHAQP